MTFLTDRQTFRETVAAVAEKARAALPQTVNGRIESAVKLVLLHDVMPQADGSILVGSSTDAMKSYLLVGTACECQDFQHGKAPDGWCQHRIAAGIHQRVGEMLPPAPAPGDIPQSDIAPAPASPAVPLPEAPASVNVRLLIDGRDCQLTLRDSDEARLLERLAVVLAQYPMSQPALQASSQGPPQLSPQQHNALAMHRPITGFCPVHNVAMQENHKDGRTWYSHRTDEGWCKGHHRGRS